MVQLEILVTVARHDGESVAAVQAELTVHGIGQAQHSVAMFAERPVVVTVMEGELRGEPVEGG